MSILLHGDCLEQLKGLDNDSVDFIFCDLPYGQTSCAWDTIIPWDPFWKEILRVKKLHTPIFFTTTTKFGVALINNAPKSCPFRYDLVWVKSAPAGFLSAKKMPMRKHEMVYCFYEKLPFYDLSSHKHKFLKREIKEEPTNKKENDLYGIESGNAGRKKGFHQTSYDPPLPVSVVKEVERDSTYGSIKTHDLNIKGDTGVPRYDPPLPVSVVKEEEKGCYGEKVPNSEAKYGQKCARQYDPPLPTSVVKEECYDNGNRKGGFGGEQKGLGSVYQDPALISSQDVHKKNGLKSLGYDPPLPVSVVKEEKYDPNAGATMINGTLGGAYDSRWQKGHQGNSYDPPLPTTMLEIKSTRGKHSTEKPVALMEWLLKYYSKEGDVVLDPTMGSGSTGVACKNMNRNFIGIEKDPDIYEVAVNRIEG
jgi:hypothetical protein